MMKLDVLQKAVLSSICTTTGNERFARGIDVYYDVDRQYPSAFTVADVKRVVEEFTFLGLVTTKYVDQWQANTYHATELGFSINKGSVLDRG